jgi:hypothetical protein
MGDFVAAVDRYYPGLVQRLTLVLHDAEEAKDVASDRMASVIPQVMKSPRRYARMPGTTRHVTDCGAPQGAPAPGRIIGR